MYSPELSKKHKKHKKDKDKDRDKFEVDKSPFSLDKGPISSPSMSRLKLILKVGGSTPEHSGESPGPSTTSIVNVTYDEDSQHSHKKSKKKDKKKKSKKHKHHKEKKRKEKDERMDFEHTQNEFLAIIQKAPLKFADEEKSPSLLEENNVLKEANNPSASAIIIPSTIISSIKEPRTCVKKGDRPLLKLLDYLVKCIEKKDPQQFFAWPVTDKIAPGYSDIIQKPMDFSTMKQKVEEGEYEVLSDFQADFILMCENAMTYNHPDTVYYKSAKKLLQAGVRVLCPEKIRSLLPLMPSIQMIPEDQLGFTLIQDLGGILGLEPDKVMSSEDDNLLAEKDPAKSEHFVPPHPNDPPDLCGSFTEELTTQEVLQQARLAAREAANKLALRKPKSKMGFLRVKDDGSTSLAILTPSNGVMPGTKEQPLTLGALSGKITQGASQPLGYKSEEKKTQRSMKPLYYGAFSSYAPSYDSTFANLSQDENEYVMSTYGEESNSNYAESLIEFAKGCDYSLRMVDEILDCLTKGQHSKTVNLIEERKKMEEEERAKKAVEKALSEEKFWEGVLKKFGWLLERDKINCASTNKGQNLDSKIDIESLRSLGDLGIDTSFLDEHRERELIHEKLQETAGLINDLERVQNERLGLPLLSNPPYVHPIPEQEINLADKVVQNLIDLATKATPGEIAPTSILRKAMGVELKHQGPPIFPDLAKLMEPMEAKQSETEADNDLNAGTSSTTTDTSAPAATTNSTNNENPNENESKPIESSESKIDPNINSDPNTNITCPEPQQNTISNIEPPPTHQFPSLDVNVKEEPEPMEVG